MFTRTNHNVSIGPQPEICKWKQIGTERCKSNMQYEARIIYGELNVISCCCMNDGRRQTSVIPHRRRRTDGCSHPSAASGGGMTPPTEGKLPINKRNKYTVNYNWVWTLCVLEWGCVLGVGSCRDVQSARFFRINIFVCCKRYFGPLRKVIGFRGDRERCPIEMSVCRL